MPLDREVVLGPGHIVLDWDPVPPPKRGAQQSPLFGPCLCGQTAGWIKMPFGTEAGLIPGHIVLNRKPATPTQKGHSSLPIFGPCLSSSNGRMDYDTTRYGGRPRPSHIPLDGEPAPLLPSPPPKKKELNLTQQKQTTLEENDKSALKAYLNLKKT